MIKRASMLVFNIIAAVILAIAVGNSAFFALCQYTPEYSLCRHHYAYWVVSGVVATLSLTTFFIHQHVNAHNLLRPKRKPRPHFTSRYVALEKTAGIIWNVWNGDENIVKSATLDDVTDVGWVVKFDNGVPVVVSQAEFFYWLLNTAKLQARLEADGLKNVTSPLSQRSNAGISRQRLDAYVSLLESINAIEYVNANVKRLKPVVAQDVWKFVVKRLENERPVVKV